MARLQFRSATQQKGFAPIQLSRASLSEMEKRDAKLLDALERKHKAEMDQRAANLKAMEDNAEYTERRFAENRKIEVANLQREQTSLNQIATRDAQQAKYDQQATQTGLDTIVNLSATLKKTAERRTAKQLEDQTALAMAEDLDPYEALYYDDTVNKVERAGIKAASVMQQEGAQSGEPLHKTFEALASERGLGLVGQRVLLNRLYDSSFNTFYNKNLENTEQKYQLPNGRKFSGSEAFNNPEMLDIVQSTTRSEVDTLMRNKHGITEALFFSKARGNIEEQNKIRLNQASTRKIAFDKQVLGEKSKELIAAGEYLDIAYVGMINSSNYSTANTAWKNAISSTDDVARQEKFGSVVTDNGQTWKERFPAQFEIAAAKGRKTALAVFEAEQKYKKDKHLQDMAVNLPTITSGIEIGKEDAVEDLVQTAARNGVLESEFHPEIKLAIASMRKNSKEAEEKDLSMMALNPSNLSLEKVNSYENAEVRAAAIKIYQAQQELFFGRDHVEVKKAILADAKRRTNVTSGDDANTQTRRFYNAYIREIKKWSKLDGNEGKSYEQAKQHVDGLVTQGELGIYDPVTNPKGAPTTNPFARGEDEQNNYIYPQLHGIDTDRLTHNDNLLITKGDAIADIPYALGSATQMAKTREEVALGIVPPIYPPLMVRALEKLNANPRYQNNPLKMSEFFQRQQDAINKVTGKNFQLVPATEEQDWMESLPPTLYKKVTSGNLFQFKHVESVVRNTVGQKLRPSMGGNSGTFGDIVNTARASGAKFPELVAAQWALESNFGKAPSGMNNFFGMKATSNETSTSRMTTEYRDGALNKESANFKDYASKEDSVNDLVNRWYKNYESYQGINNANSIEEAAQMLQQQGYATDPNYANKLIQILKNNIGRQ